VKIAELIGVKIIVIIHLQVLLFSDKKIDTILFEV